MAMIFTGMMMQLFMTYCPTTTLLFSLIFIGQTRGLGGCTVHLHSAGRCTIFKFSVTIQD